MEILRLPGGFALAGAVLLAACGGSPHGSGTAQATSGPPAQRALEVEQPAGWADGLALVPAEDLDPAPGVVEIELEASITEHEHVPGTLTAVWTYNGSLPGPTIRAQIGDKILVRFKCAKANSSAGA